MSKKKVIIAASLTCVTVGLAWAVPHLLRSLGNTCCICQLEQIEGAKMTWAQVYQKTTNDTPTLADLQPIVLPGRPGVPLVFQCPKGGTYTIGRVGEPPTCSIGGPEHTLPK